MDKGKYIVPKRLNISKSMLYFPHPNFFLHSDDYHFISFGVVLKFTNVMLRSYLFSIQAHFKWKQLILCCTISVEDLFVFSVPWCVLLPCPFQLISQDITFLRIIVHIIKNKNVKYKINIRH